MDVSCLLRLPFNWIYRGALPDVADLDIGEPFRIAALDVVFVPVRGDDQIQAFLSLRFAFRQLASWVIDRVFQQLDVSASTATYTR